MRLNWRVGAFQLVITSFEFDSIGIGKPLNMYLFLKEGGLGIAFYQSTKALRFVVFCYDRMFC